MISGYDLDVKKKELYMMKAELIRDRIFEMYINSFCDGMHEFSIDEVGIKFIISLDECIIHIMPEIKIGDTFDAPIYFEVKEKWLAPISRGIGFVFSISEIDTSEKLATYEKEMRKARRKIYRYMHLLNVVSKRNFKVELIKVGTNIN